MSNANELELQLLGLINEEREEAGLDPLRLITALNAASEDHSQWMLETDTFSHAGAGGSTPHARMTDAGYPFEGATVSLENIGWQSARGEDGYADDVEDIHEGLMQSPGHRANILNPDVEDIGLGVEIGTFSGSNGAFEAVMVTEVFGKTDADVTDLIDPGTVPVDDMPDEVPDETPDEIPEPDETPDPEDAPDEVPDPDETPDETPDTDETPDETPDVDEDQDDGDPTAEMPDIPLPCDLENFSVDLTGAFEFRQEGDEFIWETSEDKLIEAFLAAFEDWTAGTEADSPDTVEVVDDDPAEDVDDIDDLVTEGDDGGWTCGEGHDDEGEDFDDWLAVACG